MAEEFGMMGGLTLLGLYSLILVYGFAISMRSQSHLDVCWHWGLRR